MGNRGCITTAEKQLCLYLHWQAGRDSIEPFLKYCELKGYRSPSEDCYGWARLAQCIGNFFGGTLSVGIDTYDRLCESDYDNGVYIIDGWEIVGREYPYEGYTEQQEYDFDEMLHYIDSRMPQEEQLGAYLDADKVAVSDVKIGDDVWMFGCDEKLSTFPVVGFGTTDTPGSNRVGIPYVARYEHDEGNYSWNPNNYLRGDTVRIVPRR